MPCLLRLTAPQFCATSDGPSLVPPVEAEFDEPGIVRLAGPNGSGKSTLLELCGGWLTPTRGSVEIAGHPARSPAAHRWRAMVRERPALYGALTIRDHVEFVCRLHRADVEEALERAQRLGLSPWLDTPARHLSTGTEKKAWLVTATIGPWSVGFFDEPFLGLDDDSVGAVTALLRDWSSRRLVVLVDHTDAVRPVDHVIELPTTPHPITTQE